MSVLVAYEGRHGSTQEIATRVADRLRAQGEQVDLGHASEIKDVTGYQGVVVGSAVYFGSWVTDAAEFVRKHAAALRERPTWLFSSGPVGDTSYLALRGWLLSKPLFILGTIGSSAVRLIPRSCPSASDSQ